MSFVKNKSQGSSGVFLIHAVAASQSEASVELSISSKRGTSQEDYN